MSFEDFLKEFHPHTFVEYERSLVSWDDLTPDTTVMTLRSGFSVPIGGFKRVTDEFKKTDKWEYKILESLEPNSIDRDVLMRRSDPDDWRDEHWWQCVVAVDYEHIMSLLWKEQDKYIKDVVKGRRVR